LFLLVDRFCGSACEDFVMPFKDTGRGVLVGETTQGSSGNPYRADLGDGISVAVGAKRYRFPDGQPFEGVGIAPDVLVERRISSIAAGRDDVLDRVQLLTASDAKGMRPNLYWAVAAVAAGSPSTGPMCCSTRRGPCTPRIIPST
jgi:carboxyl-terminal processing protease